MDWVDIFLDVLSDLGVPLTGPARSVVRIVEGLLHSRETRQRLENLFREAEEDFRKQARQAGLDAVAQWVASLPVQELPTFHRALEILRDHWDETPLIDRLAQEWARIPGISESQRARALALYLDCLRARLVADERFGPVVVALSVLRTERKADRIQEAVGRLQRAVNALLGLPEDLLAWPVQPPPAQVPELRADLLHPKYRLIPYTGRRFREALEDLLAWARGLEKTRPPVGLRVYIGPGGAGKTRLLIEAGEALREEGWWVGFLRIGRLTSQNASLLCADVRPTLVIVDYIADRSGEVRLLLKEASRAASQRDAPLAMVLLERTFPSWLEADLHAYTDPEYVNWPAFLTFPTVERAPRSLPALEPEDRPAFLEAARERFAALLPGAPKPALRYRAEELPESPLYILLLAMLAAEGTRVDRPVDPARILEYVWGREREAWRRHLRPLFQGQPEERLLRAMDLVEDLAVAATLGRVFPDREALEGFLRAHFRPIPGVEWHELAERIEGLFPRAEGALAPPIAPDPLADWVLARRLERYPDRIRMALPTSGEAADRLEEAVRAALKALTILARLRDQRAADPSAREQVEDWMRDAAKHLAGWPGPARKALHRALPEPDRTLALRAFEEAFYRAWAEQATEDIERAAALHMWGYALSALGRREEALKVTQEGVDLYRQLAVAHPETFRPDLARSLTNLGVSLSKLGRQEEALKVTQEAVDLYHQLAAAHPEAFQPDLASSLNNLGARLSALGRREEALKVMQEGVDLYRQLAAAHPEAFQPDLASSLNNLGVMLSELGWREEALEAAQEAVGIYRELAQANP